MLASDRQTPENISEHQVLSLELEKLYYDVSEYWQQQSKTEQMREGDRNTTFFHAKATKRAQVNQVNGLKDRNGVLCQTRERVEKIVKEYFWGLFKSTNTEGRAMDAVLSAIEPKLTDEANQTPLSLLLVMR